MTLPRFKGLGSEKDGTEEVRGENEVIIEDGGEDLGFGNVLGADERERSEVVPSVVSTTCRTLSTSDWFWLGFLRSDLDFLTFPSNFLEFDFCSLMELLRCELANLFLRASITSS
jgi:hypothetical protein